MTFVHLITYLQQEHTIQIHPLVHPFQPNHTTNTHRILSFNQIIQKWNPRWWWAELQVWMWTLSLLSRTITYIYHSVSFRFSGALVYIFLFCYNNSTQAKFKKMYVLVGSSSVPTSLSHLYFQAKAHLLLFLPQRRAALLPYHYNII